jgi:HAD superfamily hydrolase (TIGR01509 family)
VPSPAGTGLCGQHRRREETSVQKSPSDERRGGPVEPDPGIYRLLCARYAVAPERCVLIDDRPRNVEGARSVGMHALHFTSVGRLRGDLAALGVRC